MAAESGIGAALLGKYLRGRYELTGILAEGPRSVVFRAKQTDLGRDVAVKLLALRASDYPELGQRLARTVQRSAKVHHGGVAEVYEHAVSDGGFNFVAMELLTGTSLRRLLRERGRMSPADAVEIGAAIASALGALHAQGIVHANLSPAGVYLVPNHGGGRDVKLIGAGMALPLAFADVEKDATARRTLLGLGGGAGAKRPAVIYGTPEALCPELAYGKEPDARSDVYALGVLLYWMLSGSPPFAESTWETLVARHIAERPEPLGARVPELPKALERVVMRALEKEPDARFASAAELKDELWRALLPEDAPVVPVVSSRWVWVAGVALASASLLGLGAWALRRSAAEPASPTAPALPAPVEVATVERPASAPPVPPLAETPHPEAEGTAPRVATPQKPRVANVPTQPSAKQTPTRTEPEPSYQLDDDLKDYR